MDDDAVDSSNEDAPLLLDGLPTDVMQAIADHLNPVEVSRLSSCCKGLRRMLPPLLCLRIVKMQRRRHDGQNESGDNTSSYCLAQRFFASKATVPMATLQTCENDTERAVMAFAETKSSLLRNNYRPLQGTQRLEFGTHYWFWSFDYKRNRRLFLGRQVRITDYEETTIVTAANNNNGTPHIVTKYRYGYHVGLQPYNPNQTWQIHDLNAMSTLSKTTPTSTIQDGGYSTSKNSICRVPWGVNVGLSVGGTHPKLDQPDSTQRRWLSAPPASRALQPSNGNNNETESSLKFWHVSREELGDNDECHLQLMPCQDYYDYQQQRERRELQQGENQRPSEESNAAARDEPIAPLTVDYGYHLVTYPTPEVCDKGLYLLYSPDQLRFSTLNYPGSHARVPFHFFTWEGMMYFRAHNLHFWLGIPILLEDSNTIVGADQSSPLLGLFHKRSSRWGCIKYYFATSADVNEGTPLNMPGFLARVTDHDDHTVLQKQFSRRLVATKFAFHRTTALGESHNLGADAVNAGRMVDNDIDRVSDELVEGSDDEDDDEKENLVYIHVKDAILDKTTPNFLRDDSRVWQFVLC